MAAKPLAFPRPDVPRGGRVIAVRLKELSNLFNTMDPAPFREKELNRGAEAYILTCAKGFPKRAPLELVVHLDHPAELSDERRVIQEAVQAHFARRSQASQRDLQQQLRQGRAGLVIGLLCLTITFIAGETITRLFDHPLFALLRESLLIGGWVAMWRPLETFLYDCWPILGERRVYDRLSQIAVRIVHLAESASTCPPSIRHQYTSWGV